MVCFSDGLWVFCVMVYSTIRLWIKIQSQVLYNYITIKT